MLTSLHSPSLFPTCLPLMCPEADGMHSEAKVCVASKNENKNSKMVHRLPHKQSQKPASSFLLLPECTKAEGTPTKLEQDGLSFQHSSFQGLLCLACSRWQSDCSPAQRTPIHRIKEKLQHKNSYTNRKQSRQCCYKHLMQTAQPSPLCWLVSLPRECGHWHCQPVSGTS